MTGKDDGETAEEGLVEGELAEGMMRMDTKRKGRMDDGGLKRSWLKGR